MSCLVRGRGGDYVRANITEVHYQTDKVQGIVFFSNKYKVELSDCIDIMLIYFAISLKFFSIYISHL